MQRKKLFNVSGNDDITNRRMVGGNVTNLFNLNNVKYQWANKLYRLMMENFWIPEKVSLFDDKRAYDELTPAEQKAYDGILSFLVFLDSIQTNNLPNISDYITAPEVNLILAIQTYQEAVHSQSYAYIIESIIPAAKREEIYNKWREDKVLLERNKYIAEIYQDFIDNRNDKNFARVLVANFLLEGLYFYNGFNFFYNLAARSLMIGTADEIKYINRDELTHCVIFANFLLEGLYFYNGFNFFYNLAARSLMIGTADEIKYINRDELTHCVIFANIIKEIRQERHDFFNDDEIYEMFAKATEQEINWSNHIIGNRVMGITPETIEQYTKFMANKRLKEIGMQPLFEGFDSNPYKQLENIADTNGAGSVKGNFFEANVSSYNQSTAIEGWEEI